MDFSNRRGGFGREPGPLAVEPPALTVLLAEDDPALRQMLASALRRDGHDVRECCDGGALAQTLSRAYDEGTAVDRDFLVVTDVMMPVMDGLTVLGDLRANGHRPPFMLITAFVDPEVRVTARALNAVAVFDKPFDIDGLRAAVKYFARWRCMSARERSEVCEVD